MNNQKAAEIVTKLQNNEEVHRHTIMFTAGYFTAIMNKHHEAGNLEAEEAVRRVITFLKSKV